MVGQKFDRTLIEIEFIVGDIIAIIQLNYYNLINRIIPLFQNVYKLIQRNLI
jgi:hypothetical protein